MPWTMANASKNFARDKSTHKGANWRSKYVTQVQQRRPESPTVTRAWRSCKYKVHKLHQRYILKGTSVEFLYLAFTRMPGERCRRVSGLCCCICVTYFERLLTPLCVDFARALWASFCFRLLPVIASPHSSVHVRFPTKRSMLLRTLFNIKLFVVRKKTIWD